MAVREALVFGGIWHVDHRGGEEYFFELDECVILLLFPVEEDLILGQVVERSGESREIWDEYSIKVAKFDEQSNHFYQFRWSPITYGFEFSGIHVYLPILDY